MTQDFLIFKILIYFWMMRQIEKAMMMAVRVVVAIAFISQNYNGLLTYLILI